MSTPSKSNRVLAALRKALVKSYVNLDHFGEVSIHLSEARETVIICRSQGSEQFRPPTILVEDDQGRFNEVKQ